MAARWQKPDAEGVLPLQVNVEDSTPVLSLATADLHCHLLPDWDDGPRNFDESLQLATRAVESGIKTILVTPHVGRAFGSKTERDARQIATATAELEREIKERGVAINLVPGAELILTPGLAQRVANEPWLTVGGQGRHVLVECPFNTWTEGIDRILFEMSLNGVTPIIAHPERLSDVQKDLSIIKAVAERGAMLQITARSLTGSDRRTRKCSEQLLAAGLVSLVASDAHRENHVAINDVVSLVAAAVGEEMAHQILVENPANILFDISTS